MNELPQGWSVSKIGEICKSFRDGTHNPPTRVQTGIPLLSCRNIQDGYINWNESFSYISESDFNEIHQNNPVELNDILLTIVGSIGRACVNKEKKHFTVQRSVAIIKILNEYIEPYYIQYFLSSPNFKDLLFEGAKGTAQKGIYLNTLKELSISLAPLNEQRRIVAKLEKLLAKIDTCKERLDKIPAILKRFRQSVLAAACSGRLTADWRENNPDVETAKDLVERITDQVVRGKETGRAATINIIPGRAALSVGDPKTEIPEKWYRVLLLKIAVLESGHTPSRKHPEYWGGDIPWISLSDARQHHGNYIFNTFQYTNEVGLANSAARLLPRKTVCLSRTASVGYVVIMGQPMATSQDFVNWICSDALLPKFLMYAFLAENEHLLKFGKGTTHTTIYFPEVKSFHITLPPLAEQQEIVNRVENLFKIADRIEQRYQKAKNHVDQLTQSILAKAFRGELVPQDPNDEPASVLLQRIRTEREKREAEAKTAKKSTTKKGKQRSKKAEPQELEAIQLELPLSE